MNNFNLPPPFSLLAQEHCFTLSLVKGDTLYLQGSETTGLYFLQSGSIDLIRSSRSGHDVVIHRAREQELFAEASLFSPQYHCTAMASSDATVLKCQKGALLQLIKTNTLFSTAMMSLFATQIQESRRRIELLSISAADERIMAALLDGASVEDISKFSDFVGLAPATTYRALASLHRRGKLLKISRGKYQLPV